MRFVFDYKKTDVLLMILLIKSISKYVLSPNFDYCHYVDKVSYYNTLMSDSNLTKIVFTSVDDVIRTSGVERERFSIESRK